MQLHTQKQLKYFDEVIRLHVEEGLGEDSIAMRIPLGHTTIGRWITAYNSGEIWRKNVAQNVTPNVTPASIDNQGVTQNGNFAADKNVAQNVAQSISKKDDRIRRVLTSLISTPTVSQEEIAGILGVTRRTINRDLDILRQSYTIEWVGSPKTGYWKVEHK